MRKRRLSAEARQAIRSTKRRKKLGSDARCSRCGYADQSALQTSTLCYECAKFVRGESPIEDHHVLGESNDPSTVSVPGNPHRSISNRQLDWEIELQRGDPVDPLLVIARLLRAIRDAAQWAVDRMEDLVQFLLRLRQRLIESHGGQWWDELALGPLWGSA